MMPWAVKPMRPNALNNFRTDKKSSLIKLLFSMCHTDGADYFTSKP